jgi:desulfoferrodoxin-like iron-binding protein
MIIRQYHTFIRTAPLFPPTDQRHFPNCRYVTEMTPVQRLRAYASRDKPYPLRRSVMTRKSDVHKCEQCGCIVSVLKGGDGDLTCCGKQMREVTPDEAKKLSFGLARPGAP